MCVTSFLPWCFSWQSRWGERRKLLSGCRGKRGRWEWDQSSGGSSMCFSLAEFLLNKEKYSLTSFKSPPFQESSLTLYVMNINQYQRKVWDSFDKNLNHLFGLFNDNQSMCFYHYYLGHLFWFIWRGISQ